MNGRGIENVNVRAIKRAASLPLSLSLASYFQWLHSLLAAWALDLSKALTVCSSQQRLCKYL